MPAIVAAVAGAAAGSFIAGSVLNLAAGSIMYGVVSGLTSAVVGTAVGNALGLNRAPKAPTFTAASRDRQQMIRSPAATRRVVYGETVVSGPIVFACTTGAANKYLHVVVPLAHGESAAIGDIWFGDTLVGTLDGSGNVTTGRFSGKMRIRKYLGTASQTADADLVSESAEWGADHRLRGITYLYVRLDYDATTYPYGLENIKADVRGRALYDTRTDASTWSDNWALVVRDYLTASYGLAAAAAEVDATTASAAANACDERVRVPSLTSTFTASVSTHKLTLATAFPGVRLGDGVRLTTTGTLPAPLLTGTTYYVIRYSDTSIRLAYTRDFALIDFWIDLSDTGTGTHTVEHYDQPRYTCNGSIDLGERPIDILRGLLTGALGQVVYSQGAYWIHPAVYATPTVTLTEDDLRGPVTLRTRPARQDLFNGVRGTYVSPANFWQPADFPVVTNATYETQDGDEQILRDLELPYTIDSFAAQRLAKIALERGRQGITCQFPAKLTAFKVRAWDTVMITIAHLGWSAKVFRVHRWTLQPDGGVDLELQEEASASYSWSSGEATVVDSTPDTTLPSLVTVSPPTSINCYSGASYQLAQADGVTLCRIFAEWTAADDALVSHYEVQHKLTADSDYQSQTVSSAVTAVYISPVESGSDYHVRVRAVRLSGALSAWEGPDTIAASSDATTFSVDYADVTGTKPPSDADNTVDAVEAGATVTSGGITFSAGGAIKGGQTDYNTGTGWFLGYSGGQYKFSIGDPSGSYIRWTGSAMEINASISAGGLTLSSGGSIQSSGKTYAGSSAGFFLGYTGGAYKLDVGNSTKYIRWDGSSLTIGGDVIVTGNLSANAATHVSSSMEQSYSFINGPNTVLSTDSHASSSGNPTNVIEFCCMVDSFPGNPILIIYRDSTSLIELTMTTRQYSFTIADSPGDASSHTYSVKVKSGYGVGFNERSLIVYTHKR